MVDDIFLTLLLYKISGNLICCVEKAPSCGLVLRFDGAIICLELTVVRTSSLRWPDHGSSSDRRGDNFM